MTQFHSTNHIISTTSQDSKTILVKAYYIWREQETRIYNSNPNDNVWDALWRHVNSRQLSQNSLQQLRTALEEKKGICLSTNGYPVIKF